MTTTIPRSADPTVRYLSTTQAYDLWSAVYDTDGNFLQALDTIEVRSLLLRMLDMLNDGPYTQPWKFVDLGCGTGRNTAALLEVGKASAVVGLDVSPGMLEVAERRLQKFHAEGRLKLEVFDMLQATSIPESARSADAVVSTLVIEHVPADIFFATAGKILKPGGILLLTNMHSEMGKISQAGFIDPKTGEKIRPISYAHTTEEVETAALGNAFELLGPMEERAVDESMVTVLGERSQKWVGVTVWFGGIFRKKGRM
ncbi:putative methyltransferase AN0656 [Cladophialophora carrionii]|uniref:Putative methyltransferase AN0656 n=1 Tax=Cladophialophora carrionii TaxID=86049 RepID=A0A1C1CAJ5_9EURO|nr:putative methyltransferase AN0656 [Cladophialophora carrionii]